MWLPNNRLQRVAPCAVHFVDVSDSLSTALARSIDLAGPANYCPVLVGSIGGARWGCGQVTEAMLRHHGDLVPRLTQVALALGAMWRTPDGHDWGGGV